MASVPVIGFLTALAISPSVWLLLPLLLWTALAAALLSISIKSAYRDADCVWHVLTNAGS